MTPLEIKRITPHEMIQDIESSVRLSKEDKYAFQTGLKDLDFDVSMELLAVHGLHIPFASFVQAEQALIAGAVKPVELIEYDDTRHQVLAFDARPVGFSGFMNCVTHSLALTNWGLFEVGRYPAVSLGEANRCWQWFLHRQLACPQEAFEWQTDHHLTTEQFIYALYAAMTGLD